MQLDHIIIRVNDLAESLRFYTEILGLASDGKQDPFERIRVTPDLLLLLAPFGTSGDEHYAFSMGRRDFEATFGRIREAGLDYGDSFHSVGNMQGPGEESGARGLGKSLYCFDPNHHLIEIRTYE